MHNVSHLNNNEYCVLRLLVPGQEDKRLLLVTKEEKQQILLEMVYGLVVTNKYTDPTEMMVQECSCLSSIAQHYCNSELF